MADDEYHFPFGRPVSPRPPSARSQKSLFVLGAYPSALHVQWSPPSGRPGGKIGAIAVDDEPEVFWNGADAAEHVARWREEYFNDQWGEIKVPPGLNGPSGAWVDGKVLKRFGKTRADAWITDCLNTYRVSDDGATAIKERFVPFALDEGLSIPKLAPHPTESEVVAEALGPVRLAELRAELSCAAPDTIVTLGNAALRVMREMVDGFGGADPGSGLTVDGYGTPFVVTVNGREVTWYPLCHPAAPKAYQDAHEAWMP